MHRALVAAGAVALVLAPSAASLVNLPQNDGDSGGDAENACVASIPPIVVLLGGDQHGTLVPTPNGTLFGDPEDNWRLNVTAHANVTVNMDPAPNFTDLLPFPDYDLDVLRPDCATVLGTSSNNGTRPESVNITVPQNITYVVVRVYVASPPFSLAGAGVCGAISACAGLETASWLPRLVDDPPPPVAARYHCDPLCSPLNYTANATSQ